MIVCLWEINACWSLRHITDLVTASKLQVFTEDDGPLTLTVVCMRNDSLQFPCVLSGRVLERSPSPVLAAAGFWGWRLQLAPAQPVSHSSASTAAPWQVTNQPHLQLVTGWSKNPTQGTVLRKVFYLARVWVNPIGLQSLGFPKEIQL